MSENNAIMQGGSVAESCVLQISDLHKSYGSHPVLEGVSFSIPRGKIVGLLGPNGCGKSTALAVLCGGYKPQRGKCKGKVQTALLAQDTRAMFAHDTVEAELRQTARIHGQMERWEEVTEKLQIAPLLPKHPYDISVGERQRAALAKCLLTGAGVLLLDEPTKGMDAFSKHRLAGLLATAKRMGPVSYTHLRAHET